MREKLYLLAADALTLAGTGALAAYAHVATGMSGIVAHPTRTLPSATGEAALLWAPVSDLHEENFADRLATALAEVLSEILAKPPEGFKRNACGVYILLPPTASARGRRLPTEAFNTALLAHSPHLFDLNLQYRRESGGAVLMEAVEELCRGRWETVLFAGADSLINGPTLRELSKSERIASSTLRDALVPGEAAAAVLLGHSTKQALALVQGIGSAPEPQEADGPK